MFGYKHTVYAWRAWLKIVDADTKHDDYYYHYMLLHANNISHLHARYDLFLRFLLLSLIECGVCVSMAAHAPRTYIIIWQIIARAHQRATHDTLW